MRRPARLARPRVLASHGRPVRWTVFLIALVLGFALDVGTKWWAFEALPNFADTRVVIEGWFSFTHATNRGAAFGLFQGRHTFFMVVSLVAFVAVPYFVHTARRRPVLVAAVLGLILAGVGGNFWDRVVHGFVRDFLDVHTPESGALHDFCERWFGRHVWPTFNVADIFITVGAITMVVFFGREEAADEAADEAPSPGDDEAPRAAKAPAGPAEEPTGPASTIPAPDVPPSEEPARDDPGGDPPARDDPPARERPAGDPSIGDEPEPARPGGGS